MMDEKDSYKGLHFRSELMKEHKSAKACYEYVRQEELNKIIPHFNEWYDNYVKCMHSAPNGTLGIFYAPSPQHPEINEEYFNAWKKFMFDTLDKIILFLTSIRFSMITPEWGRESRYNKDWMVIYEQAINVFDIYLKETAKNAASFSTDTMLQNIFNKEFNDKDKNK